MMTKCKTSLGLAGEHFKDKQVGGLFSERRLFGATWEGLGAVQFIDGDGLIAV